MWDALRECDAQMSHDRQRAQPSLIAGGDAVFEIHKGTQDMLTGKTAVVTGSTSGIGLGIAKKFASAGANIVLNGLGDPDAVEDTRSQLARDHNVGVVYSNADMTKPDEIEEMIELGETEFGSVDILVNNAGIQFVAPVDEFPQEKWDAVLAINLSSAFHASRFALPGMKE